MRDLSGITQMSAMCVWGGGCLWAHSVSGWWHSTMNDINEEWQASRHGFLQELYWVWTGQEGLDFARSPSDFNRRVRLPCSS